MLNKNLLFVVCCSDALLDDAREYTCQCCEEILECMAKFTALGLSCYYAPNTRTVLEILFGKNIANQQAELKTGKMSKSVFISIFYTVYSQ